VKSKGVPLTADISHQQRWVKMFNPKNITTSHQKTLKEHFKHKVGGLLWNQMYDLAQ